MNPHYHPYSELSSPHPPSPDSGGYPHHAHHHHAHHHPHHGLNNGHHHGPDIQQQPPYNNNNNNNGPGMKQCAGCGGKIVERFLLHALDRYWHNGCLKCSCCGAMLADIGSSCFTKGNMILCKTDYTRMFGSSGACAACGQTIPASEFVMRTGGAGGAGGLQGGGAPPGGPQHHVFHLKCFACSKCGAQLVPGDRYYMLAGSLVCEQDWHKLLKASAGPGAGAAGAPGAVRKGKVGRPRRSRD